MRAPIFTASARPRVLLVIDTLDVGGAQHHVLRLARGLARKACDVTVVSTGTSCLADETLPGVRVISASSRPSRRQTSSPLARAVTRLVATGHFDLIHAHLYGAWIAGAIASRQTGVPLVITRHSLGAWQGARERSLQRAALRRASATIAVSREIAGEMERDGCRPDLIPNGVELSGPPPPSVDLMRQRLGIPPGAFVIGYVGRLVEEKDPLLFAEAAARVALACPSAHFLVVGDGSLGEVMRQRTHRLGIAGRFTHLGLLAAHPVPFSILDVLLFTSRSEGSPLAVLEAMAASKPVVSTAVGDVPAQIAHGVTGFVTTRRDPDALARQVVALADADTRARFGYNAHARVARHFTLDRVVSRTLALYERCLALGH